VQLGDLTNVGTGGRVAVFVPSLLLTITIEHAQDCDGDVHLHAGGQGFWVAHLAAALGAEVVLCCALGGESGRVLKGVLDAEPMSLRAVQAPQPSGVYIHDRRSGERVEIVNVAARPLERHASDELYGVALAAGLDSDVTLVCGCQPSNLVDADLYRRLVSDLRVNGATVIADLTGPLLASALAGGVNLLKISDEELRAEGGDDDGTGGDGGDGDGAAWVCSGARRLARAGAAHVVVTRASAPALLVGGDDEPVLELVAPTFHALDHRGAGDSLFAATGVGLARGMTIPEALRLGMAAGALNVTRHGLGTGTPDEIDRLARHVEVRAPAAG
jgi:1-phosphofructokinase